MNIIFIIGVFISLFQFVLLLNKRSKSISDKILAIWMLVIAVHLLSYHLYNLGYWNIYPHLVGIAAPIPFLYGPFLYLYVSHAQKNSKRLSKTDYLHFIPVTISYLYLSRFYFFYSAEEKRMVDSGQLNDFENFSYVLLAGFIISGITYSVLSYRLLNKHESLLDNNFSCTDHANLNWLKGLIWGIGFLFFLVTVFAFTREAIGVKHTDYIIYSTLILGVVMLGFFGIRHQNIFTDNIIVDSKTNDTYIKSGLKDEEAQQMLSELKKTMDSEKLYLEPKLSLTTLANLLNTSPNHLSQVINQYEKKNFNEFINQYRVNEFVKLAKEKPYHSYLALALEAGFNSKSTFNKLFKKYKGTTPSEFLDSTKESSAR